MADIVTGGLYPYIGITDDYMFTTVLCQHPEICLTLLRYMLPDITISHVAYKPFDDNAVPSAQPNVQQTFSSAVDAHGVRLDVYYDDGKSMFDVEMHNGKDPNLPKRARYTRSSIDATALKRGEKYHQLRPCYVIYICTFDPYDKGLYLYTAESRIVEDLSVRHEDEAYTLYFNVKGTKGKVPEPMKEILRYIRDPQSYPVEKTNVDVIKQIDEAVKFNQQSAEWRREYSMLQLHMQDAELRGERKGRKLVARTMFEKNMPEKEIAALTKLTPEELLSIKEELDVRKEPEGG
ncbi:MAG: Rpn family recombination-promoting nuclease/putative transposase [Oscillospiraceae bacterium]|nr:Rpn family recombination-promoting nuclease/putative transposase [Oscillospiraceae bacterium]